MSQQMYKNIHGGLANGSKILYDACTPEVVNGWENRYPSTPNKYLARAIIAKLGGVSPVILRNNCIVGQGSTLLE